MFQIQTITDAPNQKQNLILPDGSILTLSMRYVVQQYGWFMSLTYGTFTTNNIRITISPNILRQFKNIIPFGMNCFSQSVLREPTQQEDFASGLFQMNVLTADEVQAYEDYLTGI